MFKKNFWLGSAILFIGMSVIISGYFIGDAIKSVSIENSGITPIENKVLNLTQVAQYLAMSEGEVKGIIHIEKQQLEQTGSFHGKMFPYFTVNNKQYFYKNEIDEWLKEVSGSRTEYNIREGWILR